MAGLRFPRFARGITPRQPTTHYHWWEYSPLRALSIALVVVGLLAAGAVLL